MTHVHLTAKSANAKTGPIPVSTTEEDTCPPSCPLNLPREGEKRGPCYAKGGHQAIHWRKVSAGERGTGWREFCDKVRALPSKQLWRHDVSGDLPGKGEAINGRELRMLTRANEGKRGFTYTHKLPGYRLNARHIAEANAGGFTVNLSANTLREADAYARLKIGPVVTLLPADVTTNVRTPRGRLVVVCPATQREDVTCATCKLCSVGGDRVIVGFPAHGASKRKADIIARG